MSHSLYIHIPFCTHRCAYCDFNTYAGQNAQIAHYVGALCRELALVSEHVPGVDTVHTVFFGGGTPTLLTSAQAAQVLRTARDRFHFQDEAEITIEANPGTVTLKTLTELRSAGFNRLSLGVQSANGEELRMLERTHDFGDVLQAVAAARRAGFRSLNVDLIFGLPEQALQTWRETLRRIIDLEAEHVSVYCLTLEHGTPFGQWMRRGLLPVPDPDLAADMYELASEVLTSAGYRQYEISNWSKPGHQCRHNLQYWRAGPYLGLGAGAHGYSWGVRYANVLAIKSYIGRLRRAPGPVKLPLPAPYLASRCSAAAAPPEPLSPAVVAQSRQTAEDEMADFMIMGLRLTEEGIDPKRFEQRFGRTMKEVYGAQLSTLAGIGLLETGLETGSDIERAHTADGEARGGSIRLTRRGRLLGNRVFAEFLN